MHEVTIEGEGTFEVDEGTRLVNALEDSGVDISHRCGGHSQCTTCRVEFEDGEPEVMTEAEYEKLDDIDQLGDFRLACQIVVDRDMTVKPLMRVSEQNWDDAGDRPAITVEPAPEWFSVAELEDRAASEEDEGDA